MKVLGDKILIKQDDPERLVGKEKLILAPERAEKYPNMGKVLAVGPGVELVKVGDRVVYERKPESSLDPDCVPTHEYYGMLVLPEGNILAVIDE